MFGMMPWLGSNKTERYVHIQIYKKTFNPFPSGFKQKAQKIFGSVYYIDKWGKTSATEVV